MNKYLLLLRGVNVGGKNRVPMAELKAQLQRAGYDNVSTYINSGNVIVSSGKSASEVRAETERIIKGGFKLDSELIKVLVLTDKQLQAVVDHRPEGFGDHPNDYYSDVVFLISIDLSQAMLVFDPREGVDKIWPGEGVIYSQRLSAERTKSRLAKIIGTKPYFSMTIRSWNTVTRLLALMSHI